MTVGGFHIKVSVHALEQFRDRVRPALPIEAAAKELTELVTRYGEITRTPPEWVYVQDQEHWLVVGDLVVFPIRLERASAVACTCITPGLPVRKTRLARRERKRDRRARRARNRLSGRREAA